MLAAESKLKLQTELDAFEAQLKASTEKELGKLDKLFDSDQILEGVEEIEESFIASEDGFAEIVRNENFAHVLTHLDKHAESIGPGILIDDSKDGEARS